MTKRILSAVTLICIAFASQAFAEVRVLSTYPQAGAKNVDPSTKVFKIRFSGPVNTGGWSFVNTNEGLPIESTGMPAFSENDTVCTRPIVLYPGLTYSVSINSERFQNFRSAKDPNVAVTPYMVTFTTAGTKPTGKAAEVRVVSTFPQAGATDVDPSITAIKVRFSGPVRTDGWSFVTTDFGAEVPTNGRPTFSEANTICTLPVKLRPSTKYAVSINSEDYNNFRNAKNPDVPVTPFLLTFTTAAGSRKSEVEQRREDLKYLAEELPKRHKNLFFKLNKDQFQKSVVDLDASIPKLEDYQYRAELLKLVAAVGDPHTGIDVWTNSKPVRQPVGLYWFGDGIRIVSAASDYKQMVGCKVEGIGNMDITKACEAVAPYIAHANDAQFRKVAPIYLTMPEISRAAGIISDQNEIWFKVTPDGGTAFETVVKPVISDKTTSWVEAFDASKTPLPLYQSKKPCPNWVEYVKDGNLVYFCYKNCSDTKNCPIADMRKQVESLLAANPGSKLVIDLRNNGGGSSPVLDPFIDWVKSNSEINHKDRLFVIIGRRTFSSAILNADRLRGETKATFVGEPTGGSPNHYGQVETFQLPNSGFKVSYSIKYFHYLDTDKTSLEPDILAELTFKDFVSGKDPALEVIKSSGNRQ